MSDLSLTFTGIDKMGQSLAEAERAYIKACAQALRVEAELIMTDSKQHYVPVDLGTLRSSGHVLPVHIERGQEVSVELVYGGAAAPYALIQHEVEEFNHVVGEWKYLEKPLRKAVAGMQQRLAERVARLMKGESVPSAPRQRDSRGRFV